MPFYLCWTKKFWTLKVQCSLHIDCDTLQNVWVTETVKTPWHLWFFSRMRMKTAWALFWGSVLTSTISRTQGDFQFSLTNPSSLTLDTVLTSRAGAWRWSHPCTTHCSALLLNMVLSVFSFCFVASFSPLIKWSSSHTSKSGCSLCFPERTNDPTWGWLSK